MTRNAHRSARRLVLAIGLAIMALSLVLFLAGCATTTAADGPVYVTTAAPAIPAECSARCPAEPKLPIEDITDIAAAKDRSAMKTALRCEAHYRRTCAARLKVLLPPL
jgi:hypothetical protein